MLCRHGNERNDSVDGQKAGVGFPDPRSTHCAGELGELFATIFADFGLPGLPVEGSGVLMCCE